MARTHAVEVSVSEYLVGWQARNQCSHAFDATEMAWLEGRRETVSYWTSDATQFCMSEHRVAWERGIYINARALNESQMGRWEKRRERGCFREEWHHGKRQ